MKKSMFLAMCLTASFLGSSWGGVNSAFASNASMSVAATDEEGGENEGEASKASVVFIEEAPTLTIKGQGDLTTYTTTDWSSRVFTDKAVGFVFTDNNGTKTSVTEGAQYQSATTYYSPEYTYTELTGEAIGSNGQPVAWKTPFGNVTTTNTWKESVSNVYLYECYYNNNSGNPGVVISNKTAVTTTSSVNTTNTYTYNDNTYSYYIKADKALTESDWDGSANIYFSQFQEKGITALTPDALKEYYTSVCTYPISTAGYFVSHDNGSTYVGLAQGQTYTYQDGDKFYSATATYNKIEDNAEHFTDESGLIKADPTSVTVAELTRRKIANGTYTTVKFENTGSDVLLIDNDIVQATLYKYNNSAYTYNEDMVTLDLGAATVKDFTSTTFDYPTGTTWMSGNRALKVLTLPLVPKAEDGTITVPSQIFAGSTAYYSYITKLTIPEGYTNIAARAFGGDGNTGYKQLTALESVTFPTSLTTIGDNAFEKCGKLQSVSLNEGLKTIGKYAFWSTDLRSISFPTTLDKIDDAAFMDLKYLTNLKFNEGLRYIGKSAFAWANNSDPLKGDGSKLVLTTLEIPTSVKYIGPSAFGWHEYQDVYFLGEDAPVMPMGTDAVGNENQVAFAYQTYMINNGLQPNATVGTLREDISTGWANRVNYQGTGGQYASVIHYPTGLSTDKANKYQDQTRIYKTIEPYNANTQYSPNESEPEGNDKTMTVYGQISLNTGTQVNYGYKDTYLGEQYIWPSMTQIQRAYIYNSNGYNWDGTTTYAPELEDWEKKILIEAGFLTESSSDEDIKAAQKYAHLGTRMFVLGMADAKKDVDPTEDPDYPINIKSGGHWWTLVVPFNMTKKMVDTTFGDGTNPTHVCRFNKVDRITSNDNTHVKLYFTDDVYAHKAVKTGDNYAATTTEVTDSDDVVIYAHEAYMIYPTKSIDYDKGERFTVKDYTLEPGSPMPTLVKANVHDTSYSGSDNTEYRFIGNYIGETASSKIDAGTEAQSAEKTYVPQYSYMYIKKKNDTRYKFWFWYGKTANGVTWNPNTCVVQATAKDGGATEYNQIFGGNKSGASQGAKQISVFGDEDDTTGVENVEIIIGTNDNAGVIYNLNGQPVSSGSTAGLAKGIYIQNGKKFIVK